MATKKEKDEQEQVAPAATAEIAEEAKTEIDTARADTAPAKAKNDDEELVPIRLFKDNERYKDDVFVAVNGRRFQIKRGETVKVPRYIAEVLEQSMNQDEKTANLITRQSEEYATEAAKLGM